MQDKITCPKCRIEVLNHIESPNGGELFVGEDMSGCTECFDPDILMYKCDNEHFFYVSTT